MFDKSNFIKVSLLFLFIFISGTICIQLTMDNVEYVQASPPCLEAETDKIIARATFDATGESSWRRAVVFQFRRPNGDSNEAICGVGLNNCNSGDRDGCYCESQDGDKFGLVANVTVETKYSQAGLRLFWTSAGLDRIESSTFKQLPVVYETALPSLKLDGTGVSTFGTDSCKLSLTKDESYTFEFCVGNVDSLSFSLGLGSAPASSPASGNCTTKTVTVAKSHFNTNYTFSFLEGTSCARSDTFYCLVKQEKTNSGGFEYWIIGVIAGGVVLIIIIAVIIYVKKFRKPKESDDEDLLDGKAIPLAASSYTYTMQGGDTLADLEQNVSDSLKNDKKGAVTSVVFKYGGKIVGHSMQLQDVKGSKSDKVEVAVKVEEVTGGKATCSINCTDISGANGDTASDGNVGKSRGKYDEGFDDINLQGDGPQRV